MKRSYLVRLLFLMIAVSQLSGCIIEPWWHHDRGRHEGEYRDEHHEHHGDHDEGHGGYGERR